MQWWKVALISCLSKGKINSPSHITGLLCFWCKLQVFDLSWELQFKIVCWYFHCSPVTAAIEVKLHTSSYLLGLHTLAQVKHLSFMKIFLNALHRCIAFLCDRMTPGPICRWGHFILTIIYWANVIVVILIAENHKIPWFGRGTIVWTLERYSSAQY